MSYPRNSQPAMNWKLRLSQELRRDKKKTAVLATLLVVGGIMGGRLLVKQLGPSSAEASVEAPVAADAPTEAAPPATTPRRANPRVADIPEIDRTIDRDLFRPNEEFFPPIVEEKTEPTRVVAVPAPTPKDDKERRARLIRAQARALQLESTMVGSRPTAIVNGQVLHKGEWISGFEVKDITSRSCVVEKEDVTITLDMRGW